MIPAHATDSDVRRRYSFIRTSDGGWYEIRCAGGDSPGSDQKFTSIELIRLSHLFIAFLL
jgi:hypothetical protein